MADGFDGPFKVQLCFDLLPKTSCLQHYMTLHNFKIYLQEELIKVFFFGVDVPSYSLLRKFRVPLIV